MELLQRLKDCISVLRGQSLRINDELSDKEVAQIKSMIFNRYKRKFGSSALEVNDTSMFENQTLEYCQGRRDAYLEVLDTLIYAENLDVQTAGKNMINHLITLDQKIEVLQKSNQP